MTRSQARADQDRLFMEQALALARRGRGRTSPNPMVGCVLVRNGRVLATGYHRRAGLDHAEVAALRKVDLRAPGATAYVTLEPCNHVGRTGKCTEALLGAGVARVVIAMRDPNPRVAGGGIARLRQAGIEVTVGVCQAEAEALNEAYLTWVVTGRPFVTLKAAITLDGRLAARSGESRWISGETSRAYAHQLRNQSDAILVGANTIARDNPRLTTRLPSGRGNDPKRIILDGKLSVPATARAVRDALIITARSGGGSELVRRGAELVRLPSRSGRVDLVRLLDELGRRQITSLLVEGGADVLGQFVAAGLGQRLVLFVAPKLLGADGVPLLGVKGPQRMSEAWPLEQVTTRRLGDDILIVGNLQPQRTAPSRRGLRRRPPVV